MLGADLSLETSVEMELIEVVFGSHATIAKYFDMAQFHPALQAAPGYHAFMVAEGNSCV